ncbi:MAG TPA: long-chain N-acyl amino acid synthase [Burkholderiales bacterium]|nr:long-chain N-acyl amino acid synthase [Burkholderiales bacterium]
MKETLLKWLKGDASAQDVRVLQAGNPSEAPAPASEEPVSRNDRSGQTIFSAEALDPAFRFRSLTVAEPDTSALEGEPDHQPAFKIRLAKSAGFRREATGLVGRRYTDRGYLIPKATQDPNLFTFLAYDEGKIVGTVSIRLDSEEGLASDDLYSDELNELRHAGCRVCEFTRLAVDVAAASKPVLAGLFHTAYLYAAKVRGFKFAVIEVNPRHVAFYRRALQFEPIGPERMNQRVQAPAVLLGIAFDKIGEGVARFGGKAELAAQERSLFPYGFSLEEEVGILQRLAELDVPQP